MPPAAWPRVRKAVSSMSFTVLQVLWYFLIFLLIGGYFVFDGFDLGVGVLSPFLAKSDADHEALNRSIGPVWDGNEVWLLTAGGALFAAFAPAYATTFSGFYLAIMLVLFGLILRAVALEYAHYDHAWRKLWHACFFVGSLLPALLTGVAVGNIYAGIPMDAAGNYSGVPLLGLVTPFTLLCGILGLVMMCAAGAAWVALKTPVGSALRKRAVKLRFGLQVAAIVVFVVVTAFALMVVQPAMDPSLNAVRWVCAAVFAIAMIAAIVFGANDTRDLASFVCQSVAAFALVALLATSMFPNLVVASADSVGATIGIANAVAGDVTLFWMTAIACIGVPLVLIYHVFAYRTFRGRVEAE